ncbi:hypothetical protein TL16_g06648 [Triparma laevis f. inornata]|uniref:PNPLA domain-containing protein n=1 Tax=Triparma laevis f. inornata TaxID=1714386 RepID=A0A9W7ANX3_9STRA|nr:hypothetical protein TL16_g06648 [Triparma laevis f. inornata]
MSFTSILSPLLLSLLLLPSLSNSNALPSLSSSDTICATPPYKKLVLEGGGVKGIAYGGCLAALAEAGLLDYIDGVAGSSAGSQAAAMVAAGYNGLEIVDELLALDFTMFLTDGSWNPLSDVNEFVKRYGWFSGETVTGELDKKLQRKTGLTNTTMAQLHKHTGKEFRVTAVDVITKKLVYIDHNSFPDMPVAQAVRASSSIPYFFRPVQYGKHLLVDGGCIRNLPHDAFPAGVDGEGSVLALSVRGEPSESVIDNIIDFSSALAETVLFGPSSANALIEADDDEGIDVVQVDYGDVSVVDFYLSDVAKVELLERGYNSVNDRLLECKHPGAKRGLPEWLTNLKLKTAEKARLRDQGLRAGYSGRVAV